MDGDKTVSARFVAGFVVYVDADASGADNGASWDDAFTDLQDGLDAPGGEEIWVAEGTYLPTVEHEGSGDRYRSYQLKNGVALYGGFDPSVGDVGWQDRDWAKNVAILSCDIGTEVDPADNCYHVFYHPYGTDLDSTAILDGFVVTGGNADGSVNHGVGGGMYNRDSSPNVSNCAFSGNSASAGGGMYNRESSPVLTNCTFEGNTAIDYESVGGGMYNNSSSPTLSGCTFSGSRAWYGAAIFNSSSSPVLTNCTFFGNEAGVQGGALYNSSSWPTLTNCILWADAPDEIYGTVSCPVTYSDVEGGYSGEGNMDEEPLLVDPDNGDFHLQAGSPCIDAGSNDAPNLPAYDFERDGRILDGDGDGTATVDMGVDEVARPRVYLPMLLRSVL
jgi:parallel beta-helix repeat protein